VGTYRAPMAVEAEHKPTAAQRIQQDQNRVDFLEFLYYADERDNPEHPYANTYTGLFQDYCFLVGEAVLASLAVGWHETEVKGIAETLVGARTVR